MIGEQIINEVLEELEQADFDKELHHFKDKNQLIYAYLMNEQLDFLTEEEFQLMIFDAMVIVKSYEKAGHTRNEVDAHMLEDMESKNWNLLQNSKPVGFHEKLDIFFNDTSQEDLLAFVEDSLAEDDELQISSAAREIIFICLKSILDIFENQ